MNYVGFLKSLKMVGQIDPLKKDDGTPAYALLVSVDIALQECNAWGNQDMARAEFLSYLRDSDILVFSNIEEFINWKKDKLRPSEVKAKFKRKISPERRKALQNHAQSIREKIKGSTSEND